MRSSLSTVITLLAAFGCGSDCPAAQTADDVSDAPAEDEVTVVAADAAGAATDETLVLDGTPEIPEALAERMRQFQNTRSATVLSIGDDGERILVSTRFADVAQLHELRVPMGARRQLTFTDEPLRQASLVPGDDDAVIYSSDIGGSEDHQLYRLDRGRGVSTLLTDGTSKHSAFVISGDGQKLAYNGNGRNGADMDVYVSDGRDPDSARRVFEREGYYYPLDFSRDGEKLLVGEYVSINDSRLWVVDLASGDARKVTPETPVAAHLEGVFGAASDTLYVTTDREGEFRRLYEVDVSSDTPTWRVLTSDIDWNVERIAISHDRRTLALSTNEDGYSVLRLLDTRSRRLSPVRNAPRGYVRSLTFAPNAPILGFTMQSATDTGDAYTYDVRRRRVVRWTESEVGGLDPSRFVEPTLVRYPTFDERQIPAFYYRPEGDGPFPVVIYIHGGPESQARPWFSPLTQYLVSEAKIAVIAPNVRGSDGYGKSYLLLDNGARREDSVRDIGALLDWVDAREELDGERTAVFGGSYGGYMVLASMVHYGDRLRAGVDNVGISNFVTFLENTREYRRDLRRAEYGDERDPEMRAHLTRISPLNNVDRMNCALFVAHGANDPRVPASEAEQIVEAVRRNGHDVWYMLANNEGHGFQKKENRDVYLQLTVMFLMQHLGAG
jgi:dipeptidyl aminopeptidase/acylaminoacyl peptidase